MGGVMILASFVNSLVQLLGLAVVVPVLGLAVKPELIQEYPFLIALFEYTRAFGIVDEKQFVILLSILLVLVFALKILVSLVVSLFQARFSYAVTHRLSGVMWVYHFSQSLEKLRGEDSGRILSEINNWPGGFAGSYMVGVFSLVTEFIVVGAICIGLLAYAPVVFLSVGCLIALGAVVIQKVTSDKMRVYGEIARVSGPRSNSLVTNAVRGVLEVLSFGAVEQVRAEYLGTTKLLYRISGNRSVYNALPAKTYELLAIVGVCGAIVLSLSFGSGDEEFFELLSLMVISAYRVMPTVSRVNNIFMGFVSSRHPLEAMEKGVSWLSDQEVGADQARLLGGDIESIELCNVHAGYAGREGLVVDGVSCSFSAGRIHGIMGPSGSGKTTLLNVILGLHALDKGEVVIHSSVGKFEVGRDLHVEGWLRSLGYLSQAPFFFSGTVRDNLTFKIPGREVLREEVLPLIQDLGLSDCLGADPLDFVLNEAGTNLSGGQQQRLALVRALYLGSPVLILDEATSALDPSSKEGVFSVLKKRAKQGCLIIVVTHDADTAAQCDDILHLGP